MQCVNGWPVSAPIWFFLVVAVLSHARGTVLLLRAVFAWFRPKPASDEPPRD